MKTVVIIVLAALLFNHADLIKSSPAHEDSDYDDSSTNEVLPSAFSSGRFNNSSYNTTSQEERNKNFSTKLTNLSHSSNKGDRKISTHKSMQNSKPGNKQHLNPWNNQNAQYNTGAINANPVNRRFVRAYRRYDPYKNRNTPQGNRRWNPNYNQNNRNYYRKNQNKFHYNKPKGKTKSSSSGTTEEVKDKSSLESFSSPSILSVSSNEKSLVGRAVRPNTSARLKDLIGAATSKPRPKSSESVSESS